MSNSYFADLMRRQSTIDYRNIFVLSFKILKTLLVDFINNFLKKYHTRIIKNFKML